MLRASPSKGKKSGQRRHLTEEHFREDFELATFVESVSRRTVHDIVRKEAKDTVSFEIDAFKGVFEGAISDLRVLEGNFMRRMDEVGPEDTIFILFFFFLLFAKRAWKHASWRNKSTRPRRSFCSRCRQTVPSNWSSWTPRWPTVRPFYFSFLLVSFSFLSLGTAAATSIGERLSIASAQRESVEAAVEVIRYFEELNSNKCSSLVFVDPQRIHERGLSCLFVCLSRLFVCLFVCCLTFIVFQRRC
jgi:hypothetical protein